MTECDPMVTIVVATYDRPDTLRAAIEAARLQRFTRWSMLVIGDCCSASTQACVEGFADPRVRYVNLPERCYEQSGPNSVGLALTQTPFVAFLNHDDLWTPDHLELALAALERSGADFFLGRAAFCTETALAPGRLMFTEASPLDRTFTDAFTAPAHVIEPASAWVLNTAAARRVGPWRSALETCRTPIQDWVLRAWRADLRLVCGEAISVLKPRAARPEEMDYQRHCRDLPRLLGSIGQDLGRLRADIEAEIAQCAAAGLSRAFNFEPDTIHARVLTTANAQRYRGTGRDAYELVLQAQNQEPGGFMRGVVKHRTGEAMRPRPPLDALIEAARDQLGANGAGLRP